MCGCERGCGYASYATRPYSLENYENKNNIFFKEQQKQARCSCAALSKSITCHEIMQSYAPQSGTDTISTSAATSHTYVSHTHTHTCAIVTFTLTSITCSARLRPLLAHCHLSLESRSLTHTPTNIFLVYLFVHIYLLCCINNLLPFTLFHFSLGILSIHVFIIFHPFSYEISAVIDQKANMIVYCDFKILSIALS